MSDPVLLEVNNHLARITLNRPESFNALDKDTLALLAEHCVTCAVEEDIHAVVLTGAGKAFCAGGDLKSILAHQEGIRGGFWRFAGKFHEAVCEIRRMSKPVIGAINGVAAGGGFSLALALDFRIMAASAKMKCAYYSAGLTLDGGGSFALPRLVGTAKAMEIVFLDKPMSADKCLELGLVTEVVEDALVLARAEELARQLAQGSRHAYGWAKCLITQSHSTTLEAQLEMEREGISACGAHPDGTEGMNAFAEKRPPTFNQG